MTRAIQRMVTVLLPCCLAAQAYGEIRPLGADVPADTEVAFESERATYRLTARGPHTVSYSIDVSHPEVAAGMLRVISTIDGSSPLSIVSKAGTRYRDAADQVLEPVDVAAISSASLVSHTIEEGRVVLRYQEQPGASPLTKAYRVGIEGLSLVIDFESASTRGLDGYAGVSLGHAESNPGARVVELPYLPEPIALFPDGSVATAYLDPSRSSAVSLDRVVGVSGGLVHAHARSIVEPDTSGSTLALGDRAYVTHSPSLDHVLPGVKGRESPFRSEVVDRLVLDVWHLHNAYPPPEGIAITWDAQQDDLARITVTYRDLDGTCGDGVDISLWRNDTFLVRRIRQSGQTEAESFAIDVSVAAGDILRLEALHRHNNYCDATELRLTIETSSGTYDTVADFSSEQGHRGFSYLETIDGVDTPMTWDFARSAWRGSGDFSMAWRGGLHPGMSRPGYRAARNMVRRYREYGMTRLAILYHDWQHFGYDAGLPAHHPANPRYGNSDDMRAFIEEARESGMLVALHENYTDMYPHAPPDYPSPLFNEDAIALDRFGNRKMGWLNAQTGQQAYRVATDHMLAFARAESPKIALDYGPNAAFLDVHTGWCPSLGSDFDASKSANPTLAHNYARLVQLFEETRLVYGAPLFGEAGEGPRRFDSYFAGFVDGVERQVERRSRALVAPDYELRVVRPRMLNHGMGYYARYFVDEGHTNMDIADVDLDQYRASQIVFGHAGFLGDSLSSVKSWPRLHSHEYWLMQALQSRYADVPLRAVVYHDDDREMDLREAIRDRLDLSTAKVRIDYDDALTVWVNRDSMTGRASTITDFSHEQGFGGFHYMEEHAEGMVPMTWDPAARLWRGEGAHSFIGQYILHPASRPIARTFTAPASGSYRIEGKVEDLDKSCGDGVRATIRKGQSLLWVCDLPGPGEPACGEIDLVEEAVQGEVFAFIIDEKASNHCDTTLFTVRLTWTKEDNSDWVVSTMRGAVTLPPSGFLAEDESGFRAMTVRAADGTLIDKVVSSDYLYANSRDRQMRLIGSIRTDGAVALLEHPHGLNIHGVDMTEAEIDGRLVVRSSARGDFNLRVLDETRMLVTIRDLEEGTRANLLWSSLPGPWKEELSKNPRALEIVEIALDGRVVGVPRRLMASQERHVVLPSLDVDQTYLVSLSTACGDGVCDPDVGETCETCPADCPTGAGQVCCDGLLFEGDCCPGECPDPPDPCEGGECDPEDPGYERGCGCHTTAADGGATITWVILFAIMAVVLGTNSRGGRASSASVAR